MWAPVMYYNFKGLGIYKKKKCEPYFIRNRMFNNYFELNTIFSHTGMLINVISRNIS